MINADAQTYNVSSSKIVKIIRLEPRNQSAAVQVARIPYQHDSAAPQPHPSQPPHPQFSQHPLHDLHIATQFDIKHAQQ